MAGIVAPAELQPDGVSSVPVLLRAVWEREPAAIGQVRGRWRWRSAALPREAVCDLLTWKVPPDSIPVDPSRFRSIPLEAIRPGDLACEVLLYPTTIEVGAGGPEGLRPAVYLLLFYAVTRPHAEPSAPERARGYYRVVEALDRMHDALVQLHPGVVVRAIDLPMPGWMRQAARPTEANFCPLQPA